MTPNDVLLRVLSGEASLDTLPPDQREKAHHAFEMLRAAVAAPAFDADRLRDSLRKLRPAPSAPAGPTVFASKPVLIFGLPVVLGKVAAVLLACSLCFAIAWQIVGTSTKSHPIAEQLAPDRWKVGTAIIGAPFEDVLIDDGVVLLKQGNAQIVNNAIGSNETEVLRALEGRVAFSVQGSLRGSVRVIPQRSAVALSVYEVDNGRLQTAFRNGSQSFQSQANSDALVLLNADDEVAVAQWLDVTTPLPPVTQGEVLLRLRSGRIVHGVVTQQSPDGILLHPTDAEGRLLEEEEDAAPKLQTENNRLIWGDPITHQPESILAEEIAGWVPRQTPRGRELFARWLSELLPAQLRGKSGDWRRMLEAQEISATSEFANLHLIPRDWLLPEVTYKIQTSPEGTVLFANPNSPELGAGWYLDATGQIHSTTDPNPGRDF